MKKLILRLLFLFFVILQLPNGNVIIGMVTHEKGKLDLSNYCTTIQLYDSVEVALYTPSMFRIRISHLKGNRFPDKYEIPFVIGKLENWDKVTFQHRENIHYNIIETEAIRIKISKDELTWKVWTKNDDKQIYPSDGPIYGMFRDGYTVFDNASAFGERNNNCRYTHWFYNPKTKRYVDTYLAKDLIFDEYFIYGPGYEKLFVQLNELVGPEPLLPKKAYGFFQTQHLGCNGDQKQLLELARKLRERDIPCDNLIIDFEWGDGCPGEKEQHWGGLDWSPNYMNPLSPREMSAALDSMHYNVMLIHHSAPNFPNRETHTPKRIKEWTAQVYPEKLWWEKLKAQLDIGVDGTWQDTRQNDITDGLVWDGIRNYFGLEQRVLFMGCRKMMELNPWELKRDNQIPANNLIGSRRYPFRWTGDISNTYSELKWHIKAITNTHGSMKGVSYITADSFGKNWKHHARWNQFVDFLPVSRSHTMKPWDVKLDLFELAKIMDFRSEHSELSEKSVNEVQNLLEELSEEEKNKLSTAENSIRKHRKLRYRLLPYIYSTAYINYLTGMPICRPMLISFPDDLRCDRDQWPYQYMFGEFILAAPVYADLNRMEIYLPEGSDWIDYWSKEIYEGGQVIDYNTSDVEKLPLFVKAGAIIPMRQESNWIDPSVADIITFDIYPEVSSSFTLYEDDGISIHYQDRAYSKTVLVCRETPDQLDITLGKMNGSYKGKPSERFYNFNVNFMDKLPESIQVDGVGIEQKGNPDALESNVGWYYNPDTKTVFIRINVDTKIASKIMIQK